VVGCSFFTHTHKFVSKGEKPLNGEKKGSYLLVATMLKTCNNHEWGLLLMHVSFNTTPSYNNAMLVFKHEFLKNVVHVSLTCGGSCWCEFPSMCGGCYWCEFSSMQHLAATMQHRVATTQCNATLQHVRCVGLFPLVAMQCRIVTTHVMAMPNYNTQW
jgi:hypothetical protein